MFDVLITPASATLEFTSSNGASIQLVASESAAGVITLNFIASSGSLMSLTDTFTGSLGSINDASGLPVFEVFSDNRVIFGEFGQNDFHLSGNMVGIGVQPTHKFHVSGSSTDSVLFEQTISGSIHQTAQGLSYLVGDGTVSILSQSNGQIIISGTGDGGGGGGGDVTTDLRTTSAVTSSAAAISGTVTGTIGLSMAKGVVWWTRIGLNSGSTENTDIRFYSSASFTDETLLYESLNKNLSGTFHVDGTPWSLTDFDANNLQSNSVYYRLTNSGTSPSEYTIELIAHGTT